MNLSRGLSGLKIPSYVGVDNIINDCLKLCEDKGIVKKEDKVIIILGQNENNMDYNSVMKIALI